MATKKALVIILIVFCCISLAVNGYLIFYVVKLNQAYQTRQVNEKVLAFRNMFTEKVLLSDKEVDFDTRLALETAVRGLNDQEIFDQWQAFTKAQTREEASAEAKKLLHLLVQKTSL
jgi:hypothetical protein